MNCKNNINGIKEVFLTPYRELPRWYFLKGGGFSGSLKITPIQLKGATVKQSFKNGYYDQQAVFKIPNIENNTNIKDFENDIFRVVVIDNSNRFWILGKENGLTLNANNSDLGTNKNSFSGFDLTFKGKEREIFTQLDGLDGFIDDAVLFLSSSSELASSSKLISDIYK